MTNNIGLGTAAIGRPTYINIKQEANSKEFSLPKFKDNGLKVLDDAYHSGIRFFDTSPGYGLAEQLLAEWLQKKQDPTITVSTKWGYTYVANFNPNAKIHEVKEHSLDKLNTQWQFSKKLLPYLKTYQIHSATFETGVLENVEILNRLHQLKKEFGVTIGLTTTGSNQTEVLQKALQIKVKNEPLFGSFQSTFNILDTAILELKNELKDKQFIIKEALANGRLIPNNSYVAYSELYAYMLQLAIKYKVGADAIAIRFCIDNFPTATVLSGADNCIHLRANLRANNFSLTNQELLTLKKFSISAEAYWIERKKLTWN